MTQIEEMLMKKIQDRYEVLAKGYLAGKLDIMGLICEDIQIKELNGTYEILEYTISLKVDNLTGSGSGEIGDWIKILRNTDESLRDFFYEFAFDPIKHKISQSVSFNYVVESPFFHEIHFQWDEKHYMDISYKIFYKE